MKKQLNWIVVFIFLVSLVPMPVLAAPPKQGEDPKAQADRLLSEGNDLYRSGQYQKALEKYEAALPLYHRAGDRSGEAVCLSSIGVVKYNLSDYSGALEAYQASLQIGKEVGDTAWEGTTLNYIGRTYDSRGQYQKALEYYQQALTIAQEIGDKEGEGTRLDNIGYVYANLGQYQKALDYFQQALTIAQETGDKEGEGTRLNNIGSVYDGLGQYQKALDYYQQALTIIQEVGDKGKEGAGLNNIGSVYYSLGQYQKALEYYQQALTIIQEVGDKAWEGDALQNIGKAYAGLGQPQKALDDYQQALTIAQEIGDKAGEEMALSHIGGVHESQGQYQKALDYYQQALTIAQEIGDRAGEGARLNNIGSINDDLGQYQKALEYYQQALTIAQEVGDRDGEAGRLNNIGSVYDSLGQHQKALDYYQQALPIARATGDKVMEGAGLNNIGFAYKNLGQDQKALEYFQQALTIMQEAGDKDKEAAGFNNIGGIYDSLGQDQKALQYYQQALDIAREVGDRAGEGSGLDNMGGVYSDLGQDQKALEYYQQALSIAHEIGDREGEVIDLHNIGFLYKERGDTAKAIDFFQHAVEVLESMQGDIKVGELKASLAGERSATYENLISLLWSEGQAEEALNYAERARARAFLDQLAGGIIDFRTGADAKLLEQEQALRNEIAVLHTELVTLRGRLTNELDTGAIAAIETKLKKQESDYSQLLTEIKLQSPEVAGLVSVDVASLTDIQRLLDSDTTLVEYFVMEDRTLVFIITKDSMETIAVDVKRDDLSRAIQDFRDFASLNDPNPASLKQLYSWLIAPLKDKLKTHVVGIIPHGVLHYLPFAALTDGQQYLDDEYSLFALPSASALRFIQEKRKPGTNTILALGNPTTAEPGLAPLQSAQQEVKDIANLYGTQPLIGDLATESALRAKAGEASIVHLAAHGQYNQDNPLFSAIYLAGDKQEDGRLEVNEIYSLDLTKATDLVVLSACQTDVGAVSAGDEVVGLTRAFLYAGTPTVIASLWNVDDKATTLLMERFYTHLRAGMGKAQALQQAQREVRAQYPNPYYWAAFVLTGDPGEYKQASLAQSGLVRDHLIWGIGLLGVLLFVGRAVVIRNQRKRRSDQEVNNSS